MDTPFFTVCKADPTVRALLGGALPRIYPFGGAPQNVAKPYAVYQWIDGNPFNTLSDRPKADRAVLQVDVYGTTAASSTAAAEAIRYAVELDCHITSYRGTIREEETQLYRSGYDLNWLVQRD